MQRILVIYDIPSDRLRSKVADMCLDYGLDRVQFSAFLGRLRPTHQQELMLRIGRLLKKAEGNVQLIPIGEAEWEKRIEVSHDRE